MPEISEEVRKKIDAQLGAAGHDPAKFIKYIDDKGSVAVEPYEPPTETLQQAFVSQLGRRIAPTIGGTVAGLAGDIATVPLVAGTGGLGVVATPIVGTAAGWVGDVATEPLHTPLFAPTP